jgi:hypothetical protein
MELVVGQLVQDVSPSTSGTSTTATLHPPAQSTGTPKALEVLPATVEWPPLFTSSPVVSGGVMSIPPVSDPGNGAVVTPLFTAPTADFLQDQVKLELEGKIMYLINFFIND